MRMSCEDRKTIALLTAAGQGTRMNLEIPKQFVHVDQKPLIIHTAQAFQDHPEIDGIMIVTLPDWIPTIRAYAAEYNITKLKWIITGGKTNQESICNGVRALQEKVPLNSIIVIHDGNRSNVSSETISDSIATFQRYGSAVAAIPCVEAAFRCETDEMSSVTPVDRRGLYRTQTPHTYTLEKLLWAHREAEIRNIQNEAATCTLMQKLGERIYFSRGTETNLKITTSDDLKIFEALRATENSRKAGTV